MEDKQILDVINKYGKEVIAEMVTRLKTQNKFASGRLINSLNYEVKEVVGQLTIRFSMIDYGVFVDKGRKPGKQPPIQAIKDWVKLKGIPQKAAYPIAKSIGKFGIAPTNFWSISTRRRQSSFEKQLALAYSKVIAKQITNEINNIK